MNQSFRVPDRLARTAFAALALGIGASSLAPSQAQTLAPDAIDRIMKSTALIYILNAQGQIDGSGSGSLISAQGYVLTNFHVVGDLKTRKYYPGLAVGFPEFQDQEPEMKYLADVVVADPNLDLAIIKLSKDLKGKPLAANTVFGEPVQLGDSNKLRIGEPVYLFGFPGVGGYTITFSTGIVGGFVAQDGQSSGRDWIKHSANSGPGNSGGGLYNSQGQLIGIHTRGVADSDSASRQPLARPLALGLGLMVPNVPDLRIGQGQDRVTPPPPGPSLTPPAPPAPVPGVQLAWPPARVLNKGQSWTVTISGGQSFSGIITEKDSDGDWTGMGGNNQILYTFAQDDGGFIFQVFDRATGSSYFCLLADQKSIRGSSFAGEAFFKKDKNAQTQNIKKACTVTLGVQGGVAVTLPQTSPQTGANTWPPLIAVGQTWSVSIPGSGAWRLALSSTDKDGAPTGPATPTSGGGRLTGFLYYDKTDNLVYLDMTDGTSLLYCAFEQKNVSATQMSGPAYYKKDKDTKTETLNKTCTITLGVVGTATTTTTTPTTQSAWPPALAVGQTWQISIPGLGNWRLPLSSLDKDGDTTGTATATGGGPNLSSFLYYDKTDDLVYLDMTDGTSLWFCSFEQKNVTATQMTGQAYYKKDKDTKVEPLNKTCTITLAR